MKYNIDLENQKLTNSHIKLKQNYEILLNIISRIDCEYLDDIVQITEEEERLIYPERFESDDKDNIINHPAHYTFGKIEPLDYIRANSMNFFEGNIIKYITRYKKKNGVEDLKKARFYLDKLIEEFK